MLAGSLRRDTQGDTTSFGSRMESHSNEPPIEATIKWAYFREENVANLSAVLQSVERERIDLNQLANCIPNCIPRRNLGDKTSEIVTTPETEGLSL